MNKILGNSRIIRNIVALHCVLLAIIIINYKSDIGLNSNIIFIFKWLVLGGGFCLFFVLGKIPKSPKLFIIYFSFYLIFPLLLVIGIFLLPFLGALFAVYFYQLMLPPKTVFKQENYKIITLGPDNAELKETYFYFIEKKLGTLPNYFPTNTYKDLKINKNSKNEIEITYKKEKIRYNPKIPGNETYEEPEILRIQKP